MRWKWPYSKLNRHLWEDKGDKSVTFYRDCNDEIHERRGTMDKFWELLAKSTIFQGLITLLLLVTMCYLWATGQEVPDGLIQSSTLVLGFFFGAKVQNQIQSRVK